MAAPSDPAPPGRSDVDGDSVPAPFSWYRDHRRPEPLVLPERRWSRRREHTLDGLACLALSALCFSQARQEILLRADWDFYNRIRLRAPTLLALMLSILALAAVGFAVVRFLRRVRRPAACRLTAVVSAAALLISLNFLRLSSKTLDDWVATIGRPAFLAVVVLMLVASFAWPRPALRAIRGVALLVSPLAVVTLLHITWMFLEVTAGPVWRPTDGRPLKDPAPSLRRVVWVVFDGLDQRVAFEARPPGVELPEFDRLKRESLYAEDARPPAGSTEVSMPALITGRPVVAVVPTSPNDLELTFADGKPASWRTHPNVFTRARALRYDTALIGWRLPYPRVLGDALGLADFRASVDDEHARGETLGEAFRNDWEGLVPPLHVRRLFVRRFAELREAAIRTASDGRFGLVLLHLPVPRTPALYDRATGRLVTWNGAGAEEAYLDNVALADRVMADLRRGLERMRLDDRTWIVLSAVRSAPRSKRDVGPTDHRVPFLVRPPDGRHTVHVDAAFSTLVTHDLVLALLRGSVADAHDVATWLARWPVAPPKDYTTEGRPIY